MSKAEAAAILAEHLARFEERSCDGLLELLGSQETFEVTGPSGEEYQVEAMAVWDDSRRSILRVIVIVDGGGVSAIRPMSDSLLVPARPFATLLRPAGGVPDANPASLLRPSDEEHSEKDPAS